MTQNQPKKWKTAVIVWIALYPPLTILLVLFEKPLSYLTWLPLRILVITVVVVPLVVYITRPLTEKVLAKWLKGKA